MNASRLLPLAGVLLAVVASNSVLFGADQPTGNTPPLTPFLEAQKIPDPKTTASLAGLWTGTFKHTSVDGKGAENTYLIEVGPTLTSLKVTAMAPTVSGSISAPVSSVEVSPDLQPLTEVQPATWDGHMIQMQSSSKRRNGDTSVSVERTLTLSPGTKSRHARFTYEIQLVTVSAAGTNKSTVHGEGTLTRPR